MRQPKVESDVTGTVLIPDFAPVPANGIVSLRLENAGQATLGGGVTTFGQVFRPGDLPAGTGLAATIDGVAGLVQVDVKSTYPDGSVKFAVVSLARPDLAAGDAADVVLLRGGPPAGPAIDLAAAIASHDVTVDIVTASGTTQVDVIDALTAALADGSASVWQQGALASQARVEVALGGSQRLVFDVTAFAGGGIEVEAQFNNDRAMEAVGGRVAYTAVVRMDGQEVARESVDQAQYQNWHRSFSSNERDGGQGLGDPASGWLNIQQDTRYLEATGAISPYDFNQGVSEAKLDAWFAATGQTGWGEPLAANGVTQYMPMTGGREDIGITTAANTAWILTQDARAAAYALGQAEAASGIPWNFWDAAHDTWLNTDAYPRLWTDPRGGTGQPGVSTSGGLTQQVATDTGWTPETAHHPNLSFVPYLLTGERWILDNLNAEAAWSVMRTYPASRQNAQDLLVNGGQVRASAWTLREVQGAAFANPDGSVEQAYFESVADANWAWLVSRIPDWTTQQGEAHGWLPGAYGDPGATAPWQQDHFASVAILAARHGNADALTFLQWQSNFLIGRFTHEAEGFNPHDGAGYRIKVFDPATGAIYKTWSEIGTATVAAGWSAGASWSQSNYPQLAMATLAGIYELTGSLAAADAYWAIVAQAPPLISAADYATNPTNAFAAPPGGGRLMSAGTGDTTLTGGGGDDTLLGAGGDDTLVGLGGDDSAQGGAGQDSLAGGVGDDTLLGGALGDTLDGGQGADSMAGGEGDDLYRVDAAGDVVLEAAGAGQDLVLAGRDWVLGANVEHLTLTGAADLVGTGNTLANRIEGNAGDNLLVGGFGDDTLVGGEGSDTLNGVPGIDSMVGGAGNDVYYVDDASDRVVEVAGGGIDRVIAYDNVTLATEVENLVFANGGGFAGTGNALANSMTGNGANNLLAGLGGRDNLQGGGGKDTLLGGAEDDVLNGGAGDDSLQGGAGNDLYYVDDALDRVSEDANGGFDRVVATASHVLGANVENLTIGNHGAYAGTGNALGNALVGNGSGNLLSGLGGNDVAYGSGGADTLLGGDDQDHLLGQDGNDVLAGGAGIDILTGGAGRDIFHFSSTAGWDRVVDFTSGVDRIEILRGGFASALPLGELAAGALRFGASGAAGGGAQFLYDRETGVLRWDADGAGGTTSSPIAVLAGAPVLTAADIRIVDVIGAALPPDTLFG
jgi:Ca2+-binding RTX toxin-like protein